MFVAIIVTHGCATNPAEEYMSVLQNKSPIYTDDVISAALQANTKELNHGEMVSFEIDPTDNVIELDGIKSFYEVYTFKGKKNEITKLTTYSPTKSTPVLYVVWPRIFVVSESGKIVLDEPGKGNVRAPMLGRMRWESEWIFRPAADEIYYVLITSDNRVLDEEMASRSMMLSAGSIYMPWTYNMRAHTTGPMKFGIE